MKRGFGAFVCVVSWAVFVLALAAWVRSHGASDDLTWRRFRTEGGLLCEWRATAQSARGGVRLAARWGTHLDHGDAVNREHLGPPGFTRVTAAPARYPAAAEPSSHAAGAGFGAENGEDPWRWPGALRARWLGIVLPYWAPAAVSGSIPLLWLRRARREARARAAGRCAACGYDLRASPDACPECGATTPSLSPSSSSSSSSGTKTMRLAVLPRAVVASLLVLPATLVYALHSRAFFAAAARAAPRPPMPWASPTVWAAKKNPPPPGFAAFTETIAGTTVTFPMVPIPAGRFRMGSPDAEAGRRPDEGPQVDVAIEPFYMGRFEVTQAEYDAFLATYSQLGSLGPPPVLAPRLADAVTYPTPMYEIEAGPMLQRMGRGGQHPAVIMSHYAACQYTKWLSRKTGRFYRLATEAEWEYACRAGTTTAYPFGDDPAELKDYGWFWDNSDRNGEAAYRVVGQKKPNPWGLYDMHGNVAEWVIDGYAPDRYATLAAAAAAAAATTTTTGPAVPGPAAIHWPAKRYPRVVRGGGYESEAADCRSAARLGSAAKFNAKDPCLPRSPHWESDAFWVGFRVVCPLREPGDAEKQKYWAGDDLHTVKVLDQRRERQVREIVPPYP